MMQVIDPQRYDAFVRLMSLPDPADLPHRGHVLRCEGDPDRRTTRLPRILMGWLQRRYLDLDQDLRVLRPTGTSRR